MAREHDPGDAVPPGVAPENPVPLTPTDREVLHELERFGSKEGRAAENEAAQSGEEDSAAHGARRHGEPPRPEGPPGRADEARDRES